MRKVPKLCKTCLIPSNSSRGSRTSTTIARLSTIVLFLRRPKLDSVQRRGLQEPLILIYSIVTYFVWGIMQIYMYSNHSYIVKYLVIKINSTLTKVLEKRTHTIIFMYQVFAKYKMRTNGKIFKRCINISSFNFYPLMIKSLLHTLKIYIRNDWACALVVFVQYWLLWK